MPEHTTPQALLALYEQHGHRRYDGESVTQLQHAWQCEQLARRAGADAPLRLAAWLHDVGHLLTDLPGSPTVDGIDDGHELRAARWLEPLFGPAVSQPVALHVQAKRYLVGACASYGDALSPDSRRSLVLQGGPLDASTRETFLTQAYAPQSLRLRAWDDAGKREGWQPTSPAAAMEALHALMQEVLRSACSEHVTGAPRA